MTIKFFDQPQIIKLDKNIMLTINYEAKTFSLTIDAYVPNETTQKSTHPRGLLFKNINNERLELTVDLTKLIKNFDEVDRSFRSGLGACYNNGLLNSAEEDKTISIYEQFLMVNGLKSNYTPHAEIGSAPGFNGDWVR